MSYRSRSKEPGAVAEHREVSQVHVGVADELAKEFSTANCDLRFPIDELLFGQARGRLRPTLRLTYKLSFQSEERDHSVAPTEPHPIKTLHLKKELLSRYHQFRLGGAVPVLCQDPVGNVLTNQQICDAATAWCF